jgi:hypothetical protein
MRQALAAIPRGDDHLSGDTLLRNRVQYSTVAAAAQRRECTDLVREYAQVLDAAIDLHRALQPRLLVVEAKVDGGSVLQRVLHSAEEALRLGPEGHLLLFAAFCCCAHSRVCVIGDVLKQSGRGAARCRAPFAAAGASVGEGRRLCNHNGVYSC